MKTLINTELVDQILLSNWWGKNSFHPANTRLSSELRKLITIMIEKNNLKFNRKFFPIIQTFPRVTILLLENFRKFRKIWFLELYIFILTSSLDSSVKTEKWFLQSCWFLRTLECLSKRSAFKQEWKKKNDWKNNTKRLKKSSVFNRIITALEKKPRKLL